MATVDSLDIQISTEVAKSEAALDRLIKKLGSVTKTLASISSASKELSSGLSKINTKAFSAINTSAKEAEKSIKKVSDVAKKGVKAKISFEPSDYYAVIKDLSAKFSEVGKGVKFDGDLSSLEKQAEKLSSSLDKLMRKEEKIISVGETSPESKTFKNLQYDIAETINKLGSLEDRIINLKNDALKELDNVRIVRFDADDSEVDKTVEKVKDKVSTAFQGSFPTYDATAIQAVFGEAAKGIQNYEDAVKEFGENAGAALNSLDTTATQQNFRNYTQEIAEATAKLKELEKSGKGMGSAEWDNAYFALQKVKQEAAEYKAQLDKPTSGIENDAVKTDSLGNKIEKLKTRLAELKAQGFNFGDANFDKTYTELQKTERELKEYKKNLNNTKKETSSFSNISISSFGKVTNAIQKMGSGFASAVKRIGNIVNPIRSASTSSNSLTKSIGKLFIGFQALKGTLNSFKKAMDISSDLTEVQNVVDVTFGKMAYKVDELAKHSIQDFGMSELTTKEISSRFQAMGTAMGFTQGKMSDMSIELTKLAADMASFYNVEQAEVAKSLQSVFTGTTMPLRKYGLDLTNATLQEWAHKQGIDAKIKSMSQMQKTMLRYQYIMANTSAAQGDFARTSDTWANQLRISTQNFQQLGAVIGGIFINALKPVVKGINAIMGHITSFAQMISNALGKIFGWTYEESGGGIAQDFEDAAGASDDIAGSTDKTAKSVKKIQQGLRAFDELKTITLPDKDKNKGGGSGAAGAGAGGGKWNTGGGSIIKSFESDIDSLYDLGRTISDKLSDAMKNIDWDKIYENAKNFGSGLASFLNGLINPELFGEIGKTIAGALNTALHFLDSFGETFDWKNFGKSLAKGLNSFLENIDWKTALSAAKNWGKGIATALNEFISPETFGNVGEAIGNALNTAVQFVLSFGHEFDFTNLGNSIAAGINKFFNTFNFADLADAINTWIIGIKDSIVSFLDGVEWETIGVKIVEFIKNIDWVGLFEGIGEIIWSAIGASLELSYGILNEITGGKLGQNLGTENFEQLSLTISDKLNPVLEYLNNTILPTLSGGWDRLLEILSPLGEFLGGMFSDIWQNILSPALSYLGDTVLPTITNTFDNLWNNVLVPFGSFLADRLEPVIDAISSVLSLLWKNVVLPLAKAVKNILGKAFEGICEVFNKTVIPKVNAVIKVFQFLWNNVFSPIIDFLGDTFKPAFENAFNGIKGLIDGLSKTLGGLIDFITGIFSGDWKKAWQGIKDVFKGIWDGLSSVLKIPINGVLDVFESLANKVIDAWNWIKSAVNSFKIDVPDWVPKIGGKSFGFSLKETAHITIPKLESGGYVPKTYTMFMAGENGIPEMMGTVGGKTAVAGGEEITGIKDAVNSASATEARLLREQNDLLRAILNKEFGITKNDIGKAARDYSQDYFNRTGKPAYIS